MSGFFTSADCDLDAFRAVVEVEVDLAQYPMAVGTAEGAVVYEAASLGEVPAAPEMAMMELARVLSTGPGIAIFRGGFDAGVVDAATEVFFELIEEQRSAGASAGDHFAAAGANDRIWNSLEKLALRAPSVFAAYHDNAVVDLASRAWLGPGYQLTAQVNVVNPGGDAQSPHRDYHLGFMTEREAASYPAHVHRLSPALTLQGAVAHCDMPVETGPTTYLPHSHKFEPGYLAWHRPEFAQYFAAHRSQPSLSKGDVVFFNPALFHAAGQNRTSDVRRTANLLQVSSGFGRAMESVDRRAMCEALYPVLLDTARIGGYTPGLERVVAASAEGYAFPADLDHDQPTDGLKPPSMAGIVAQCLREAVPVEVLVDRLDERFGRRE